MVTILEWSGSLLGLIGATLLACNASFSRFGWVFFLVANFCIIGFALAIERYGLTLQQAFFVLTSLLGMYRSGLFTRSGWVGVDQVRPQPTPKGSAQ